MKLRRKKTGAGISGLGLQHRIIDEFGTGKDRHQIRSQSLEYEVG